MSGQEKFLHSVGDVIVPICFIILVPLLGMFYVVDHNTKARIYSAQLASCERGNVLRIRLNAQAKDQREIYRQASGVLAALGTTQASDALAAVMGRAALSFDQIPLVDCERAVRHPEEGGAS